MRSLAIVIACAGCEPDLLAKLPDAAPPPDAFTGCPAPALPLAEGTFKLFYNTEGGTFTNTCDPLGDSRQNCSPVYKDVATIVPPFLDGVAGREAFIASIVETAQNVLAPYSIDIVRTRPTSGSYFMFVIGGTSAELSIDGDCGCGSITPNPGCSGPVPANAVDVMFDSGTAGTVEEYAGAILGDVGILVHLVATVGVGDCLCRGGDCFTSELCTYGSNVPTQPGTVGDPPQPLNCGRETQDDPARLKAALGCR